MPGCWGFGVGGGLDGGCGGPPGGVGIGGPCELLVGAGGPCELLVGAGGPCELLVGNGGPCELLVGIGGSVLKETQYSDTQENNFVYFAVLLDLLPAAKLLEPLMELVL